MNKTFSFVDLEWAARRSNIFAGPAPTEDGHKFQAHRGRLFKQWSPKGIEQEQIVESLVGLTWRRQNLAIFPRFLKAYEQYGSFFKNRTSEEAYLSYSRFVHESLLHQYRTLTGENTDAWPKTKYSSVKEAAKAVDKSLFEQLGPERYMKFVQDLRESLETGDDFDLAAAHDVMLPLAKLDTLEIASRLDREIVRLRRELRNLQSEDGERGSPRRTGLLPPYE